MKRGVFTLAIVLSALMVAPKARPQSESLRPVIDNERVTVWSLKASNSEISTQMHACVLIRLMPLVVAHTTWKYAFAVLAPGPLLGIVAMMRLRALPEATRIAQGRR